MIEDDDDYGVSKTEIKRQMQQLQALGERICELSPAQWSTLPIREELYSALEESRRIKQHEAKRRHYQYIGKLMRNEDVTEVQLAVDLLDPSSEAYGRRLRQQEQWRQRLVSDDQSLQAFINEFENVNLQQLRTLIRNARKEVAAEKTGTAFKKLFQLIREITEQR